MNIEVRKNSKHDIKKELMNNTVFGKAMGNIKTYRNIKLATTEARWNCLLSDSNYHTTTFFVKLNSNRNEINRNIHE